MIDHQAIIIVQVLLAVLAGPTVAARAIDLTPRFETGAEVHYVSRSLIHHYVRVESADVAEKVEVRTEAGMTFKVANVDSNGSATIEWTLRYVAITAEGAIPGIDGLLDYDSREPDRTTSPLAPLLSRLVERPVTVRVDAAGRVIDFQGVATTGGLVGPLGALARGFFSKQAFEQLPLLITSGAPTPVRVRSKWSRKTAVDMPLGVGSLVMDQQLKLKRIDARRRTAAIEMTGTLSKGPAAGPAGLGSALAVDDGTVSGEFIWDFASGQLVSAETQLKLKTTLDTPLGRMKLEQDMSCYVKRSTPKEFALPKRPKRSDGR